jgi:hypothetical protein
MKIWGIEWTSEDGLQSKIYAYAFTSEQRARDFIAAHTVEASGDVHPIELEVDKA